MPAYAPKYPMFFDNHTMKACPDVGHFLDTEAFAEHLKRAGIDLVGFHAKCNQGFCYYDTKIGIRHPSLPDGFDMFGEIVKSCAKRNIRVNAYFNCGLSNEDAVHHPEWCRIGMDGNFFHPEVLGWTSPYIREMCLNGPYADYLLSLVKEVMDKYDVNGFLFDGFNAFPCICPYCVEKMQAEGIDVRDEAQVAAFEQRSDVNFARRAAALLASSGRDYMSYYLGLSPEDNAAIGTYLECECIPTNPVWGYELLPLCARHLRTLTKAPVLNMTGRFCDWGDFGSLRPRASLEYDLFYGLANGMRPDISDHFPPSGRLVEAVWDRITEVYQHLQQFESCYDGAVNETEVAILINGTLEKSPALCACERMLTELHVQFDIINRRTDFASYRVLVLPDNVTVDEQLAGLLQAYLKQGGKILSTGRSGLTPDGSQFALEKDWGISRLDDYNEAPAYFQMAADYAKNVADMPLIVRANGLRVKPADGTRILGQIVAPYYNKHWDGKYSFYYAPPANIVTDIPFATCNGKVAVCTFGLCESYYAQAAGDLRYVLMNLLDALLPERLLRTSAPAFAKAFVTRKANARMIHLLAYLPELRGKSIVVEDELTLNNTSLALRLDGFAPKRAFLMPDRQPLAFTVQDGYAKVTVPTMSGYALVVFEE